MRNLEDEPPGSAYQFLEALTLPAGPTEAELVEQALADVTPLGPDVPQAQELEAAVRRHIANREGRDEQ